MSVGVWESVLGCGRVYGRGGQPFDSMRQYFCTLNLDAPHQASISFQFFKTRASNIGEEQKKDLHFTSSDSDAPRIWQRGTTNDGLGVKPPAANEFLQFSYKKNSF